MEWKFDNSRAIYIQLVEHIQRMIISGEYKPGEKLESVRELASVAKVNPNTMQRALTELERLGLVYSQRTSGRFITEDEELIHKMRKELVRERMQEFINYMLDLGFKKEEIKSFMNEILEKENEV